MITGGVPAFTKRASLVVAHYGAFSLAYFGLMAVLVLALGEQGLPPGLIAVCMTVLTVSSKVAKIPLAVVLDRVPANWSILSGCILAGASIAALPHVSGAGLIIALITCAGLGISVNGLASKQVAADASDGIKSRGTMFSILNVITNLASAIAAPIALLLLHAGDRVLVFILLGALYAASGLLGGFLLRVSSKQVTRPGSWWSAYRDIIATPGITTLLMVNAFGWFFYAQLFGALPIFIGHHIDAAALGVLIAVNAVTIVVLQVPVSHALRRIFGERPLRWMAAALALFAMAFCVAALVPTFPGLIAMVFVFSLAEASFVPSVDVGLVDRISPTLRASGYAVMSVATAIGESIGSSAGILTVSAIGTDGTGWGFWALLACAAVAAALITAVLSRRRGADFGTPAASPTAERVATANVGADDNNLHSAGGTS
ncbi:MFS transporter [Pseudarthrobacter oxydans]|uniref:MFS transporter n=1 Tax=Pseudarthrobacter oxydans TaxID=1671 RepID=UPI003428D584